MEIATQSSWDLCISALRRMNKLLMDAESTKPKPIKAKNAKDRGSCSEANTWDWRRKPRRAAPGGCSGLSMIHVGKPGPKVQEREPSFDLEYDFPALEKKDVELRPEEKKIFDLCIAKTNLTNEVRLVHGGNLSTVIQVQPSTMRTPKAKVAAAVQPIIRERYILPDFTREEAIDIFINQRKPTQVSFVLDDEMARPTAPVWSELSFPKRKLYTISEVEDETDYTREEVLEIFKKQSKPNTALCFVQGGNMADTVWERQPSFDPEADFLCHKRKDVELRPEEKRILDLFLAKTNPTKKLCLVCGSNLSTVIQVQPSTVKSPQAKAGATVQPIIREKYILPDFTRKEAIDIFIKQSKPTPVSFVQDDELATVAAPVWFELSFPKRKLYTICEVEDETDYMREEVLEMFMRQTKPTTALCFVQRGNMADRVWERQPCFDPECDFPALQRKDVELQPQEKKILDVFIAKTNPTKELRLVHGGNLSTVIQVQPSTVKTPKAKAAVIVQPIIRERYILSDFTRDETINIFINQSKPTPVSFVQDDEMATVVAPVWPELTFPRRKLYTISEVEDETDYSREEVLEIFMRQSQPVTALRFVQRVDMASHGPAFKY